MVKASRIKIYNEHAAVGDGPVVYWMNRECRAHDNWALIHAQAEAHARKVPLIVVYNLVSGFLGGGLRQWDFKVRGLKVVSEELEKHNIPFFLVHDKSGARSVDMLTDFFTTHNASLVVTDFSPVRSMREWTEKVIKQAEMSVHVVDTHNIIPVWVASDKREFGAYTIRPKIYKLIAEYLEPFPNLHSQKEHYQIKSSIDWDALLSAKEIDQSITVCDWIEPGEQAAKKALHDFLAQRIDQYATLRNDPTERAQSNLSPYLHYGQIAPARVALAAWEASGATNITELMHEHKNAAKDNPNSFAAFLEELIVRRELADNFCYYAPEYDTSDCFPDWAQKSHQAHAKDEREYTYTKHQFEHAQTHDALWNAAQYEMVRTGKMHGYMRMYWAKKILEWTPSAEAAMKIAIYLNDKYELDGRDPNGYAGIAWSIGGVHDRAWFERPVFGQIRYMNANGCKAKFDVDAYIAANTPKLF